MALTISSITTVAYIDTGQLKTIFLPSTFNIEGKILTIKDRTGNAGVNNIRLATSGGDTFEDLRSNYIIGKNFGLASFVARKGRWYSITGANASINESGPSSLSSIVAYGLSTVNGGQGVSSLSSIVAYGLSTVNGGQGVSSLSSIVAYGLSSVNGAQGISSLSSILSYSLSTVAGGQGISSLSSILSYGLSSVSGGHGVSSLSSIVSYGLSSVNGGQGISSLSSIISYSLSSVAGGHGVSSLSSILSYGLSTVSGGHGLSSLSSIVSYGLSTVSGGQGVSSLSSIVAYGLSTVASGQGVSSLSSIVSYGLSTLNASQGISSLSSIIAYGLSCLRDYVNQCNLGNGNGNGNNSSNEGVSSLSSIVAYGLSTVASGRGISSLSSIVSYGLSSISGTHGVSSLSSIISYGLSSVLGGHGVSSLSSIVSYGLSTVSGGHGVSSLSSIVSYGLSTISGGQGISSLSSIISYGLSTVSGGQGISSLSSIVSYGLSTVSGGQGISSLSSIVSYGLSTVSGGQGISSLSSIVSYGLSTVSGGQGISSLSSIIAYGLSSITTGISINVQTSNIGVTTNSVISLHNRVVVSDANSNISLYINDTFIANYVVGGIIQSLYNNGNLIVGVGLGIIIYSSDGVNWNNATRNPLQGITLTSVTYGNGYWVATGSGLNSRNIIYSQDGSYWVQNPYVFPNALYTVAYNCNANYWIVGAENNSTENSDSIINNTLYSTNNITTASFTPTTSGGFGNRANFVQWGSNIWVAVGRSFNNGTNHVLYSTDGTNWFNSTHAGNQNFFGGAAVNGNGIAYGNNNWLISGGSNVNTELYRSQNGSNFSNITTNIGNINNIDINNNSGGQQIYDIKYYSPSNTFYITVSRPNNNTQYFLKSSNNGDTWSIVRSNVGNTIFRSAVGINSSPISNINTISIQNGNINTNTVISYNIDTTTIYSSNIIIANTLTVDTIFVNRIPFVSLGFSSIAAGHGVSSLSSIVSYGLSSISGGHGLSSLSSIVSYGLSSVNGGHGVSSLSSIVAYGLSSVNGGQGISSLSSIVSYGLSSVNGGQGISSLSSIVSFGLSSVNGGQGISSLSSIVSFGLSSVNGGQGISSLSSIISYGLSSVSGGHGVSSLSSIVSYGLSSVNGGQGISSLSSIISYGLSTVSGGQGISSLSSIVSYGLSTVSGGHGVSSLSSIVSYGLSTVSGGQGISSLSSIVAYGLSSVNGGSGISSLSSIVAYSLSTVFVGSQQLQSNTYNYSFKPSSIGGTEIVDKNSNINNPDTITNAFAKVDNWLFTNMVAPPPAPTFISSNSDSTNCRVTFQNPNQFLTGFLPQPFPFINRLNVRITSEDGTVLANSNIITASNMPFPGNNNVISNVRLTIQSGVTSGYSANTFILSNSLAIGKRNFTFNITWLNNNTLLASNTLVVPNINFASADLPNPPTGLIASAQTNTSVTLGYTAPILSDPLEHYSNVLVTFCNMGYTNTFNSTSSNQPGPRRHGVTFASITRSINTSATSVTFTGLTPDTPVILSAATKIATNPTYSNSSNIYSRTTLPNAPNRLSNIQFPSSNYYTNQGIPVTNRNLTSQTTLLIINSNTINPGTYLTSIAQSNVAIHTSSNPGSSNNSIMSITSSNAVITFNGYGGTPPGSDNYSSDNNFLIKFNGSNDLYVANPGSNGFYNVANLQFGVSKNFILPSTTPYRFTTIQSNEFNTSNVSVSNTLYVDLINTPPSNLQSYNTINTRGTPYFFCSGVLSFTSNLVINSTFSVSNIASYYITHPTIGTYRIGTGVTSNISTSNTFYSDLALANIISSNTILVNSNVFITSNLFNLGNQQLFTNRCNANILNLTTTFSNIFGNTSAQSNEFKIYTNPGFCNIYFDIPSKVILDSMNSSNSVYGIRVESGRNSGADVVDFGGFFNQSNSLAGTYSNEIQLVNGFFQTKASSTDGYINYSSGNFYNPTNCNYPNYTSINSDARYLTVQFNCNVSGQSYSYCALTINSNSNFTQDATTGSLLNDITLQYKIVDSTNSNPDDLASISTAWLNGNINSIINERTKSNVGNGGFWLRPSGYSGLISTPSLRYLQVAPNTGFNAPFITYIRLGVPLSLNVKWQQLSLSFF